MRRGLDGIYLLFGLRAVFKPRRGLVPLDFGGHSEGETPLPIPNRAVKPLSADGTWWATAWESRSPPVLFWSRPFGGGSCFVPTRPLRRTIAILPGLPSARARHGPRRRSPTRRPGPSPCATRESPLAALRQRSELRCGLRCRQPSRRSARTLPYGLRLGSGSPAPAAFR